MHTPSAISVKCTKPTSNLGLLPTYDDEAQVLCVGDPLAPTDWPFGIDVNGLLICDCDYEKRLVNFDLLISRKLWKHGPIEPPTLNTPLQGLIITENALHLKSFHLPLSVLFDQTNMVLKITIGEKLQPKRLIRLSTRLFASLGPQSELLEFLVLLHKC